MAEQTILSIAEEAAAQQRASDTEALREFYSQWTMEDMPACPAGMALLKEFADASPAAFELARKRHFTDPPMLGNNPRWQVFCAHRSSCADCNESGPNQRPYDGARSVTGTRALD